MKFSGSILALSNAVFSNSESESRLDQSFMFDGEVPLLQMAEVQEWAYVVQVPPLSTLQMEPVVQFYN